MRNVWALLVALLLAAHIGGVASAQSSERRLTSVLNGANEVNNAGTPNQGDLDGSGVMNLTLRPSAGQICYDLTFRNIDTPTRGHIHRGAAGTNGPIAVTFFDTVIANPIPFTPSGCVSVPATLVNEIIANPAGFYVNIHNVPFPPGAIRGQIQAPSVYVQINNGSPISITGSEQPQVVAQFGNSGPAVSDVRFTCNWDQLIRFNGQAQNGPFPSSEFVPPSAGNPPTIFFPNRSVTSPSQLPDLPTGQNYNAGFGFRLALPTPSFTGPAGSVQCVVHDRQFNIIAASQRVPVTVR